MNKLNIYEKDGLYYIAYDDYNYYSHFRDIHASLYLNLHNGEFRDIMINKFNAFYNRRPIAGRYYFSNKQNAINALEWIESILVIKELTGD